MNKKLISLLCLLTLCGCNSTNSDSSSIELSSTNTSTNMSTEVVIKDLEGGSGDAYDPYLISEGAYQGIFKNSNEIVYFGFRPTRPGKYVINSFDYSKSSVGYYGNNSQYVPELPISGMTDNEDGSKANFELNFNIAIEEFISTGEVDANGDMIYQKDENGNLIAGGVYLFGISTNVTEETTVSFQVKWLDDYVLERPKIENVAVTESLSQYPDKKADEVWVNAEINGLLTAVYNEEDGFYHVGSKNGYILTAYISEPCLYLDKAFTHFNEETNVNEGIVGERDIILDNGTKNYTKFLEEYEKYCNSDGVYGVTEELKVFLENYFYANKAWIESCLSSTQVLDDESGWMFACGYYADVADSYKKPWNGKGTESDPYSLTANGETYEYYAKIQENSSLFYSYAIKNSQKEVHVYVKTTNENAVFVYNEKEYVVNEKGLVYLEVDLGDGMATRNPNEFVFEMKSKDGAAINFVFEVGIREDTVAGDALILGENTVEVLESSYVACSFTAPEDGSYTFTCKEEKAWIEYNGKDYKGSDGTITFTITLAEGEKLKFDVYTLDFSKQYITFTIELDRVAKTINTATIVYASNGRDLEQLKYKIIADENGGNYQIKPGANTMIIVETKNSSESYWQDDIIKVTLEPNEVFTFLVTTDNWQPGNVSFTVEKV